MDRDFRIDPHGSIVLLWPENDAARAWIDETAPEDAQFWGDALAIEPRYLDGVLDAVDDAGFVAEFAR